MNAYISLGLKYDKLKKLDEIVSTKGFKSRNQIINRLIEQFIEYNQAEDEKKKKAVANG